MDPLPSYCNEEGTSSQKMTSYYTDNGAVGGVDEYTAGSTTPSSSNSRSVATPQLERRPLFPSPEVLESAMWTSSEYSSSESFSSDDGDDDQDGSEYSPGSYSASDSDEDELSVDGTASYMRTMMGCPPPGPGAQSFGRPPILGGLAPRRAMPPPPMTVPEGLPFGAVEGLPFTLESLKRDLEKVGRAIISSNVGEVAAERAQTLASINWLASHIPNAVLDKLGHEIRDIVEGVEEVDEDLNGPAREGGRIAVEQTTNFGCSDSISEVSDLSHLDEESSDEDEEETMELVEPEHVSQVQVCYGDLTAFEIANATSFLPNEQLNGSQKDPTAATCGSSGQGILDLIPVKKARTNSVDTILTSNHPDIPLPTRPTIGIPETKLSKAEATMAVQSEKSSKLKGIKGIFERFSKNGKRGPSSDSPCNDNMQQPFVKREQSTIEEGTRSDAIGKLDNSTCLHPSFQPPLTQTQTITNKRALPYANKYRCALLFVDISGFTKLSRLLDPESLSKVRIGFGFSFSFSFGIVFLFCLS
jgi:hypothetical protein